MDPAPTPDDDRPPLVAASSAAVLDALVAGAIIAVPNVGGYGLAVRAGVPDDEARLVELAADPDGPHYAVGQIDDVRALTSGWTDELGTLLQRCWPGPVEVFLPWAESAGGPAAAGGDDSPAASTGLHAAPDDGAPDGAWAVVVGHARRTGAAAPVPRARSVADRPAPLHRGRRGGAGLPRRGRRGGCRRGRREGAPPTVVDATVSPIRVLREGALPASFIEGTMLMSTRRKLFSRTKKPPAG